MEDLEVFTACRWDTTGWSRADLATARAAVYESHPGAGIVETCQRIEAFSLDVCDCNAAGQERGRTAMHHLAAVAAGVESAVLGEWQVLGQVRTGIAPLRPRARWLDVAVASARRLRAEASFESTTGQLFDAALQLAPGSGRASLLVIGAGALGRDVARRGVALGFQRVAVASRQDPELPEADRWIPFPELRRAGPFDVVAGCLGSGAAELTPESLPPAGWYIDLGSPPNFASRSASVVPLRKVIHALREDPVSSRRRDSLRSRVRELVNSGLADYSEHSGSPIGRLRQAVESLREQESRRIARLHPELPQDTIDAITRSLVNRLLHLPTERLRDIDDAQLAERFADLFITPAGSK